jgi:hypothetical protein
MITQQQQLMGIEHGTSRTITAGQAAREAMQVIIFFYIHIPFFYVKVSTHFLFYRIYLSVEND